MKTAKRYVVAGRVQGVGYRFFVEQVAQELGLTGTVCNRSDGQVEVYAVGKEDALQQLRDRLEVGPSGARVERVAEQPAALKEYKTFSIEWRC